jgi:hypothetical protein
MFLMFVSTPAVMSIAAAAPRPVAIISIETNGPGSHTAPRSATW